MERIKRFLMDESATAEATSTVLMIAAAGILLAGALAAWYSNIGGFFNAAGEGMNTLGQNVGDAISSAPN